MYNLHMRIRCKYPGDPTVFFFGILVTCPLWVFLDNAKFESFWKMWRGNVQNADAFGSSHKSGLNLLVSPTLTTAKSAKMVH